jgi:hypothetical protein
LAFLDGNPLSATQVVPAGDLAALFDGSRLALVGAPAVARPTATTSPTSGTAAPTPAASPRTLVVGGWRWHELGLVPGNVSGPAVARIARGYVGRCGSSMCTSADGWSWQSPADPAIFDADATALFTPLSYVRGPNGGYLILAGEGIWYSADGVRWRPSETPLNEPHGFAAIAAGSDGFALIGNGSGSGLRLYSSTDGATWTDAGLLHLAPIDFRGNPDASTGLLVPVGKEGKYLYSADGRTWVSASIPAGTMPGSHPYRLADGSLLVDALDWPPLRSTDGRVWKNLPARLDVVPYGSLAVVDGRILVSEYKDNAPMVWESSDAGASFHVLLRDARVLQLADLAEVTVGGAHYVGTPLSPEEAASTTPTATGLPYSTPSYATPSVQPTPAGGISRDEAIRIATAALHASGDQVATASARPDVGSPDRWIWEVSFRDKSCGTECSSGDVVDIDYFTGEIIRTGFWIS